MFKKIGKNFHKKKFVELHKVNMSWGYTICRQNTNITVAVHNLNMLVKITISVQSAPVLSDNMKDRLPDKATKFCAWVNPTAASKKVLWFAEDG